MRTIEDETSVTSYEGSKPKNLDAKQEKKIVKEEPKEEKEGKNELEEGKIVDELIFFWACDVCICLADFESGICLKCIFLIY